MKYCYCIDVGGTDIKGGIVNEQHKLICNEIISSNKITSNKDLSNIIIHLLDKLSKKSGLEISKSSGVGIALPGLIDNKNGIVKHLPNLPIKNYKLVEDLEKKLNVPVKIENDAELATIAEFKLGAGKSYNNLALITIGTGIGLGLIIDGKPLRSCLPFSCELGHILTTQGTELEHDVSTKTLIEQTKIAMKNNLNSKMWNTYNLDNVHGKTIFEYKDSDETANKLFSTFLKNLSLPIINIYNIFTPDIIILGGGISKQGKNLTLPLESLVNEKIFLKSINKKVKIVPAKFFNEAGMLGASFLYFN